MRFALHTALSLLASFIVAILIVIVLAVLASRPHVHIHNRVHAATCDVVPLTSAEVRSLAARYDDWSVYTVDTIVLRESERCPTATNGRYRGLVQADVDYALQIGMDTRLMLTPEASIYLMHYIWLKWGGNFAAWGY